MYSKHVHFQKQHTTYLKQMTSLLTATAAPAPRKQTARGIRTIHTHTEACVVAVVNWRQQLPARDINISSWESHGAVIVTDISSDGVSILRFPTATRSLVFASAMHPSRVEAREYFASVRCTRRCCSTHLQFCGSTGIGSHEINT